MRCAFVLSLVLLACSDNSDSLFGDGKGGGGGVGAGASGGATASGGSTAASGGATGGVGGAGPTGSGGLGGGSAAGGSGSGSSTGGASSSGSATGGATAGTGGTDAAGGSTSSYSSGVGGAPTITVACQGHIYECGDLVDNDSDGLMDYQDPDCLGPCDNTEDGYIVGIPGSEGPGCTQDCYFDQDSGSGNDDCYWNHKCDPLSISPNYYPESQNGNKCAYNPGANTPGTGESCAELSAGQSDECYDFCKPLTPNGCDCFGCCELPAGGGNYVWLGSQDASDNGTCNLSEVSDPDKCQPCTPVPGCLNTCETCELCLGKDTLPPECFSGGTGGGSGAGSGGGSSSSGTGGASSGSGAGGGDSSSSSGSGGSNPGQCPSGVQACGVVGQPQCPADYFCITGCCQAVPK